MSEWRTEHDSMGDVQVPAAALWRAQTQRAVENFPVSGQRVEPALIRAIAAIKGAAARANAQLGVLDHVTATAISDAATAVENGEHADQFPIDVFQTGSGTSTNMNVNEVLSSLSGSHPNDDVNASQSSNDVFPSAIHLAACTAVVTDLQPALAHLAEAFARKAGEYADAVKSGRTHLMDATPVTLGQELGGYAAQIRYGGDRLSSVLPRVGELPLGGTAVGTGINAPRGFGGAVTKRLAARTGLPLTEARDHIAAQSAQDSLV
ncbi:MAG: fumC, partial [Frankiales bacterium]|nr:fumC [Frankiales bacterium]